MVSHRGNIVTVIAAIAMLVFLAVIVLPNYWVKHAIQKHGADRSDFPGTGRELVEHLIDELQLDGVTVDVSDAGDHYDPQTKTVRLMPQHADGRSLSAVAIAAHEVGHAVQHHRGETMLTLRQSLAGVAAFSDKIASVFFLAAPFLAVLAKTPIAFLGLVAFGVALLSVRILVHLVTLPLEFDASFKKALPILEQGQYLSPSDMPAAREVLKAAALTYVAGALISLFDLARWIRILR